MCSAGSQAVFAFTRQDAYRLSEADAVLSMTGTIRSWNKIGTGGVSVGALSATMAARLPPLNEA